MWIFCRGGVEEFFFIFIIFLGDVEGFLWKYSHRRSSCFWTFICFKLNTAPHPRQEYKQIRFQLSLFSCTQKCKFKRNTTGHTRLVIHKQASDTTDTEWKIMLIVLQGSADIPGVCSCELQNGTLQQPAWCSHSQKCSHFLSYHISRIL